MTSLHPHQSREAGVVSIFIVIFFMIFTSVIVVGFVKMVNDDQSQATDNDLSASALASAQSGAEDGKRVLLFCKTATSAPDRAACAAALSGTACDSLTGNATLTNALNIDVDTTGGRKDGIVSGNRAYQQRYTCMTIKTATDSVEGLSVDKGSSELIPLTSTGPYDSVQFSWHATAESRNGVLNAFRNNTLLPAEDQWKNGADSYAAAMRLEFIAYPKTGPNPGVDLDTIDAATRTVFLVPGTNGGASTDFVDINAAGVGARYADPNLLPTQYSPKLAKCQAATEYACTMNIRLVGSPNPTTHNYFLRVSAVYGSAYIKAELKNGLATAQFDNVQPLIDVTGRANDVFRRIQTRVQYDAAMYLPQNAVEVGELCKNMTVADRAATSSDFCNPGSSPPPPPPPPVGAACVAVSHTHNGDLFVTEGRTITITLARPLVPGCTYVFMHEWGDYHPRQQATCLNSGTGCETWRQPDESYYIEFLRANGTVLTRTPDTGDIPDRFPSGDPNVFLNVNGTTGSEVKRLYFTISVPAGAAVTSIRLVHSDQSVVTTINSVHLYGYTFTAVP